MKKLILIVLISIVSHTAYSQCNDTIVYIMPDSVEVYLDKMIKYYNSQGYYDFSFYLDATFYLYYVNNSKVKNGDHNEDYIYGLYVSKDKGKQNFWVKNSSRFILVNDKKYPLELDYDRVFSTLDGFKTLGEFGHRDGTCKKGYYYNPDIYVVFNLKGKIMKQSEIPKKPTKKVKKVK